jgi:hypothetical protein
VTAIISARGVSPDLLRGALLVRGALGRINDLIHATAVSLALTELMAPQEILRAHRWPLETIPLVCTTWKPIDEWPSSSCQGGTVATRCERGTYSRTSCSCASSVRRARPRPGGLIGPRPRKTLFQQRFGTLNMAISDFTCGPARHVTIIDLEQGFRNCSGIVERLVVSRPVEN